MKLRRAGASSTFNTAGRERCDRLAGVEQGLGADAGVVRALAGDAVALGDGHAQAAVGERARAVLTGRAGADQDHTQSVMRL